MIWVIAIGVALIILTSGMHFEIMTRVAALQERWHLSRRVEVLLFLIAALIAHVFGVVFYAFAFWWMHHHPFFGALEGKLTEDWVDFLYFSLTCYTTLGFGEIYATGDMRIVAGLEGLNGLVLIAWSASFTFLSVQGTSFERE